MRTALLDHGDNSDRLLHEVAVDLVEHEHFRAVLQDERPSLENRVAALVGRGADLARKERLVFGCPQEDVHVSLHARTSLDSDRGSLRPIGGNELRSEAQRLRYLARDASPIDVH